jgi:predicted ArsR family transcriptional regulator
MEAQKYSVLETIGSRESLDLVLSLLEKPGVVEDVGDRAGVARATARRRLDALASAGVVFRRRPRDPYEVTDPERTRRLFEAAHELALTINEARNEAERQLAKRVRRTRFDERSGARDDSAGA